MERLRALASNVTVHLQNANRREENLDEPFRILNHASTIVGRPRLTIFNCLEKLRNADVLFS